MNDAVTLALERNPRVLIALQEIEAAGGRALQAGRIPNPEIGVRWNGTPGNFDVREADERDIGVSQQIEFPGRRSGRIEVASVDGEITALALERVRTLVEADVRKAYFRARCSQDIVSGLGEQLGLLGDVQRLLEDRYATGSGAYLDVLRARIEVARIRNDLAEAKRDMQTRGARLNVLLGNDPGHVLLLTDSLHRGASVMMADSLLRVLLEKSAAMRIARLEVARQDAALGLAKTSYFPDFTLGIFHQRRAGEPPFDANRYTGTTVNALGIELGFSIPLWFWHEPKGQVQEAAALKTIAEVNSGDVVRRVRAGIQDAIAAVKGAVMLVNGFEQSTLDDARDIVATGITMYQNNRIDLLNLLDIYRTARATRLEYARALLTYHVALADLASAGELPPGDEH